MFVYEPGAGFSGVAKKGAPGDDLKMVWSSEIHTEDSAQCVDFSLRSSVCCDIHEDLSQYKDVKQSQEQEFRKLLLFSIDWYCFVQMLW